MGTHVIGPYNTPQECCKDFSEMECAANRAHAHANILTGQESSGLSSSGIYAPVQPKVGWSLQVLQDFERHGIGTGDKVAYCAMRSVNPDPFASLGVDLGASRGCKVAPAIAGHHLPKAKLEVELLKPRHPGLKNSSHPRNKFLKSQTSPRKMPPREQPQPKATPHMRVGQDYRCQKWRKIMIGR